MSRIGGAGSGSFPKKDKGLIKINLIGYIIAASLLSQLMGDSVPGNQFPSLGKSPTSVPKIELDINWKENAKARKITTVLVLESCIQDSS